jgi:hypothetical protein
VSLPATSAAYGTYTTVKAAATEDVDYAAVARFWERSASSRPSGG